MKIRKIVLPILMVAGMLTAGTASASLTQFQTFVGNVGYSSDGFGSLSNSGVISASVPAGSTVLAAYLYTAGYSTSGPPPAFGGTLNGSTVSYVVNGSFQPRPATQPNFYLSSSRADVTSIVKPIIDGGPGGIYNFDVTETSSLQDGEALVVVYENAALPTATFGILDGFSATTGDITAINFADPLDPTAAGFFAEMALGINFSCCSQTSRVTVNGSVITQNAGNFDDGASLANGSLITVGGFDDPYSPFLPTYAEDTERYNLAPYISFGDTSIVVENFNPTNDDNIFLAGFYVSGEASINEPPTTVPEPTVLSLFIAGLASMGLARRRRSVQ